MEFKGTKGKWVFLKETEAEFFILSISDEKGNWIFNTEMKTWIDEQIEADFKLVSKSPEMLQMLQRIDRKMCVTFDDLLEIKKLIKEATEL